MYHRRPAAAVGRFLLVTTCLMFAVTSAASAQTIIHVDDDAALGGDGTTWATAYKYLQDGLAVAVDGDEVHVAGGTYMPDQDVAGNVTPGNRQATFQLISGVGIYGGYRGCPGGDCAGGDPDARDIKLCESILSGDLGGDDEEIESPLDLTLASTRKENAHFVVAGSAVDDTAVLDGFTITGGSAGLHTSTIGGGMYNQNGSPTLIRCTFSWNWGYDGGGMHNDESSHPTLTNCTFSWNYATNTGGGIANENNSNPTLTACAFTGNAAWNLGGGMRNDASSPVLINCAFSDNWTSQHGGGIMNDLGSAPLLYGCILSRNRANFGGAISNMSGSPTLVNCALVGNLAQYTAGGMWSSNESRPVFHNCTIYGNSGLGLYTEDRTILRNCMVWGHEYSIYGFDLSVTYSNIQGGLGESWFGEGCIDADPMFVDPGFWDDNGTPEDDTDDFWVDGDYRLQAGSPCMNTGDATALPADSLDLDGDGVLGEPIPIDLDGHARMLCSEVDMGAYEFAIGDFDCDEAVDLFDFAEWEACMTGPGAGPYGIGCKAFDFEYDGDVDLHDYAGFQSAFED